MGGHLTRPAPLAATFCLPSDEEGLTGPGEVSQDQIQRVHAVC